MFLIFLLFLWILWSLDLELSSLELQATKQDRWMHFNKTMLSRLSFGHKPKAFIRPRIEIPNKGKVSSNLTGITIFAASGNLRSRGVKSYNEFKIPPGVVVRPYVERLVLVFLLESPTELGNKIYEMMAIAIGERWGRSDSEDAGTEESDTGSVETSEAEVVEPLELRA
ncbi:hypothetical protein NE237_023587 [Protea cynaroides]|uniref:Uncharacterized protein n=1 Tax=Protea cynaroides TaxID=273540 RepID=A0A9Q0K6Q1_9MAGN|nr:hypothetical protein NE237_023587 [Protea cynaroides]